MQRGRVALTLVAAMSALGSAETFAQSTAGQVIELKEMPFVKAYVRGLGQGISWMNAGSAVKLGKQLFCPPPNLPITDDQYMAILEEHVRFDGTYAKEPAGLVLLVGLERTFPCR